MNPSSAQHSLIPPPPLLKEYGVTAQQFMDHGSSFVHEFLIKRCHLQPNERVLDLGCGPGFHARVLAGYLSSAGSYEGLDILSSVIDFCQIAYSSFPNIRFSQADIENSHYNPKGRYKQQVYKLPYKDKEFDLIFSVSLFTHLLPDEVETYLSETSRLLKPGGRSVATLFLLNEESRENISRSKPSVVYPFVHESGCYRLLDVKNPARAVAYDEQWVKNTFAKHRLRVCELAYGYWAGGRDLLRSLQDIVVAVPA